jgi:hypothetical protein
LNGYKPVINVAENLETRNANKNEAMKLSDTLKFGNFPELRLILTMEAEIKNILMQQKSKSSTGYDGISSMILKHCIAEISKPLTHIFNASVEQGMYPDRMKFASLRPKLAKGDYGKL